MFKKLTTITETTDKRYGTWLFYTALGLFLLSFSWLWPFNLPFAVTPLTGWLVTIAQALCCLRIALFGWKHPRYVLACAVVILFLQCSSHLSHEKNILYTFMVVAASRGVSIKPLLKIYLVAFIIVLCLVPILYAMGWSSDIVKHKWGMTGHSWGFINPNRLAFLMQMLVFLVLILFRASKTAVVWAVCWTAAALVGWITLSMTSVVVLLITPLLFYGFRHYTCPPMALAAVPLLLTLLSIALAFAYGPSTGSTTFESRFSIPSMVFQSDGLSLMGHEGHFVSSWVAIRKGVEPFYMNNLYLSLVIRNGVLTTILTLTLYGHYLYRMARLRQPLILAMAVSVAVSGLMQMFALYIALNFLLLYEFHQQTATAPPPSSPGFATSPARSRPAPARSDLQSDRTEYQHL